MLAALYIFKGLLGAWFLPGEGCFGRGASGGVGRLVHVHRKGGLGQRVSGGVGRLVHIKDTLQGVAWDQAKGAAVTRPLVRERMPACSTYAPGEGVEMTGTGRLFVSANL